MKKGTIISIVIALIAVAGALLGLVAYMRSRRCHECADMEEDYIPNADSEGDYDMDYYVDGQPVDDDVIPMPQKSTITDILADEDMTD